MPGEVYELIARGARYFFLALMALIVWRSWRWYRTDRKTWRERTRVLPDAGNVGEMTVLSGPDPEQIGQLFPVPREATLGSRRSNDVVLRGEGVAPVHLLMRFETGVGLMIEPARKGLTAEADGFVLGERPLCLIHESMLTVCGFTLCLQLFEGFECSGLPAEELESARKTEPTESAAIPPQRMAEPFSGTVQSHAPQEQSEYIPVPDSASEPGPRRRRRAGKGKTADQRNDRGGDRATPDFTAPAGFAGQDASRVPAVRPVSFRENGEAYSGDFRPSGNAQQSFPEQYPSFPQTGSPQSDAGRTGSSPARREEYPGLSENGGEPASPRYDFAPRRGPSGKEGR